MIKRITGLLFCFLLLFFWSCPEDTDNNNNTDPETNNKTWVCFENNNDFSVNIYSDLSRLIKIAEAAPQEKSTAVQVDPNLNGALFYPTYNIVLDDVSIPYQGEVIIARIDAGKTSSSPNTVTIPSLEELGAAELTKPISSATYLKIQNVSNSSLSLRQGSTELNPQGSTSPIMNGGETGLFLISPGPVSGYSLRKNTTIGVNFPAALTAFASSRLYSFYYDGTDIVLLAERQLTLAQAFALSPPESISARTLPSGSISLSWDRVGTENSYKIYRAAGEPVNFSYLASTDNTSYTDNAVNLGNTYYYKLSSVKNTLESDKSTNYASAVSQVSSLSPPTGLAASVQGTSSISLSWNSAADATYYRIYRGGSSGSVNTYVAETSSTSYMVSGLSADTTYYFTVCSVNYSSESVPSNPVSAKTSSSSGGTIDNPPTQPSGLVVSSASSGSITLSWNSVSTANSYNIYRSNSQTGAAGKVATVTGTSYTNNVPAGAAYYYTVAGENSSGESPKSNMAFAYAADHYSLSYFSGAPLRSITSGAKHYYRLAVTQGVSYTIEWQNGSNQNASRNLDVIAYQNNGTQIFSRGYYSYDGYTNPSVFTATATGFVTVEVKNNDANSQNYQIYYY